MTALLAAWATQYVLLDLKAATRSAIAGVAARLRLCWATGGVLVALSVLQPALQE